jgi:hypothetical protein
MGGLAIQVEEEIKDDNSSRNANQPGLLSKLTMFQGENLTQAEIIKRITAKFQLGVKDGPRGHEFNYDEK